MTEETTKNSGGGGGAGKTLGKLFGTVYTVLLYLKRKIIYLDPDHLRV